MQIIHPSTGKKAQDIESALVLLTMAPKEYEKAFAKANGARREETAALNRVYLDCPEVAETIDFWLLAVNQ